MHRGIIAPQLHLWSHYRERDSVTLSEMVGNDSPPPTTSTTTPACAEAWHGSRVPAPRRSRRRQMTELCSLCACEVQLPRKSGLKGSLGEEGADGAPSGLAAHCCFLRSFLMGDSRVPLREETGRQPPRQSIREKAKMNGFPIQTPRRLHC